MVEMTSYWIRICMAALATGAACVSIAGCGLNVASPDLFVLHRTGQGQTLTLLVNDSGTIRCNGGKTKPISDPLLLDARDLAKDLDKDVQSKPPFPPAGRQRLPLQGHAPGRDAVVQRHRRAQATRSPELARAELFAVQAAQGPCGLSG